MTGIAEPVTGPADGGSHGVIGIAGADSPGAVSGPVSAVA